MSIDERRRRLALIRFQHEFAQAERGEGKYPDLVLRDEDVDAEEPIDLVDLMELGMEAL